MLDLCQVLSSPDDNWWTGVDYCDVFISSHSDGTHSLQSIHWLSFWRHPIDSIRTDPFLQSIHWLSFWRHPFTAEHPLTLILTAPIHCRASIDSHSDGTHSLQSIHWLSFWRHPFTAEHPLTLILTAPIHCRASIDSHSDGTHSLQSIHWLSFWRTHSLQSIHWLSFWRHPFTAEHPLTLILMAPIHCRASIDSHSDSTHHCRASIAETHFSKSDVETLIYIWDGLRVNTFTFLAELFF